jgi:hypothetical protein
MSDGKGGWAVGDNSMPRARLAGVREPILRKQAEYRRSDDGTGNERVLHDSPSDSG